MSTRKAGIAGLSFKGRTLKQHVNNEDNIDVKIDRLAEDKTMNTRGLVSAADDTEMPVYGIKGRTITNLAPEYRSNSDVVIIDNIIEYRGIVPDDSRYFNIPLKDNTIYTIYFYCYKGSNDYPIRINSVNGDYQLDVFAPLVVSEGIMCRTFKTPTNNTGYTLLLYSNANNRGFKCTKPMILEGDWTGKDIPPFFTGTKSIADEGHLSILTNDTNLYDGTHVDGATEYKPNDEWTYSEETIAPGDAVSNLVEGDASFVAVPGRTLKNEYGEGFANVDNRLIMTKATVDSEGYVTMTSDGAGSCMAVLKLLSNIKPNTAYTLVAYIKSNTLESDFHLTTTGMIDCFGKSHLIPAKTTGIYAINVTTRPDFTGVTASLRTIVLNTSTPSGTSITFKPMLFEGDIPLSEIPQTSFEGIKSVAEAENGELRLRATGKNLNSSDMELGSLSSTNGANMTWSNSVRTKDFISVGGGMTITVSNDKGYRNHIMEYDANYSFIMQHYDTTSSSATSFTSILSSNAKYIRLRSAPNATHLENDITVKYQVEKGTTKTSYEPYKQSLQTIQLQEPLRSIPGTTIKDELLHDGTVIRRIEARVIDGYTGQNKIQILNTTKGVATTSTNTFNNVYVNGDNSNANPASQPFYTKDFRTIPHGQMDTGNFANEMTMTFIYSIRFTMPGITTVSEANEWFRNNPTTVYLQLITPKIETVATPELVAQGYTHFFVDNDLSPTQLSVATTSVANRTDYIRVVSNETYTLSYNGAKTTRLISFYDANKTSLGNTVAATFAVPANCYYIRVAREALDKLQVQVGSDAKPNETYKETLIDFPVPEGLKSTDTLADRLYYDGNTYKVEYNLELTNGVITPRATPLVHDTGVKQQVLHLGKRQSIYQLDDVYSEEINYGTDKAILKHIKPNTTYTISADKFEASTVPKVMDDKIYTMDSADGYMVVDEVLGNTYKNECMDYENVDSVANKIDFNTDVRQVVGPADASLLVDSVEGNTLNQVAYSLPGNFNNLSSGSTVSSDGYITLTGDGATWRNAWIKKQLIQPNKQYTIVLDIIKNTLSGAFSVTSSSVSVDECFNSTNTSIRIQPGVVGKIKLLLTSKSDLTNITNSLRMFVENVDTGEIILKADIYEGDISLDNIPKQSFIGLQGVGYQADGNHKLEYKSIGKNLIDYTKFGTIDIVDGVPKFNTTYAGSKVVTIALKPNTQYTFWSNKVGDVKSWFGVEINGSYRNNGGGNLKYTFTTDNTGITTFKFGANSLNDYNSLFTLPQLEKGTVATEYEPYKESNLTIPIPQPLNAVGTVKDRFYYDGTVKVEYKTESVAFDSSHSLAYPVTQDGTNTVLVYTNNIKQFKPTQAGISNLFIGTIAYDLWSNTRDEEAIQINSVGNILIRINKSRLSSVSLAGITQWLIDNNFTVLGVLKEPTIHDTGITDKPLLQSYNGGTITQQSNVLGNSRLVNNRVVLKNIRANTKYRIQFKCSKVPSTVDFCGVTVANTSNSVEVTSPSTISNAYVAFYHASEVLTCSEVMVIENGKVVDSYFKGLQSTLEDKLSGGKYRYKIKAVGKNLLDFSTGIEDTNCTYVITNTGFRISNSIEGAYRAVQFPIKLYAGVNYKIRYDFITNSGARVVDIRRKRDFTWIADLSNTSGTVRTFRVNETTDYILIFYCTAGTPSLGDVEYSNVMLINSDLNLLPYEPYKESTFEVELNEPLRGTAAAQDRMYYDGDTIKVERNVKKYNIERLTIDGTAQAFHLSKTPFNDEVLFPPNNDANGYILSDNFKTTSANNQWGTRPIGTVAYNQNGTVLFALKPGLTLDEGRQWFVDNPTTVILPLKNPTIEDTGMAIPQQLSMYPESTTIYIDSSVPPLKTSIYTKQKFSNETVHYDLCGVKSTSNKITTGPSVPELPYLRMTGVADSFAQNLTVTEGNQLENYPYFKGVKSLGEDESNQARLRATSVNGQSNEQVIQYTAPLRSLPNGVADEQKVDGTVIRRVGVYEITGDEDWQKRYTLPNGIRFALVNVLEFYKRLPRGQRPVNYLSNSLKDSTSINTVVDNNLIPFTFRLFGTNDSVPTTRILYIDAPLSIDTEAKLKQWFKDNSTTIYYELATPVEEQADPPRLITYY